MISHVQKRSFWSNRLKSGERIGPHNLNIISLIVGSLLSSSYLEKRSHESGGGVRIIFIKYGNNVEYIMWFYLTLAKAGYCSYKKPKLYKLIIKGNKVLFFYVLKSYSFSSFTFLFSLFYRNNLKNIPQNLYEYITPLALATLFLSSVWAEEKAIFKTQARLNTSLSASHGLNNLSEVLKNKYNIETETKNNSDLNSGSLYIKDSSRDAFTKVVKQHILSSQFHLLGKPTLKLTLFGNTQFKRGLATLPDLDKSRDSKRKLRKEYELSLEQKQALIGIIGPKFYSTLGISSSNKYPIDILNPNFITGFTDAEGCFRVKISKSKERKVGWVVEPRFQIGLDKKDLVILQFIQKTFKGVGTITKMGASRGWMYRVSSIKDFNEIIIPHFDKYPLITSKKVDYELLKKVIALINQKEHLTEKGLKSIVSIRASINLGLPDNLKDAFPDVKPEPRLLVNKEIIKDGNWLAGFINGEGCFFIDIFKSPTTKMGISARLKFQLGQHKRDDLLIESLVDFLGCGRVVRPLSYNHVEYIVSSFSEISEKIIPFVQKYPIIGIKSRDFEAFYKAFLIIKNKEHLTKEGLEHIKIIKSGMNRSRISEE